VAENQRGGIRLNDNQRRHYEVMFARLEQSLDQIERATHGEPAPSLMSRPIDDLPERFTRESAPIIATVRALLGEVARSLELRPREFSRRRTCEALMTSEMISVENGYASRLRGYGEMDPSVAEGLDPALGQIHAGLASLRDLLRENPTKPTQTG
jgi:hypothetical protein